LIVAAKLVVTAREGGSRIALVGASGKELLASVVFTEPRAKGATLRSLKGMLGDDVVVEDHTLAAPRGRAGAPAATNGTSAKGAAKRARKSSPRKRSEAGAGSAPAAEPAKRTRKATRAAAKG
jgi:hypothetical protein